MRESLDEANSTLIETVKLSSVESAYWCRMGAREYLRWAMPFDEDTVISAVARLHAKRQSGFGGSKFLGAFRSSGIVIPVWELPKGSEAEDIEAAVAEFWPTLQAELTNDAPLTADERRARAGQQGFQVLDMGGHDKLVTPALEQIQHLATRYFNARSFWWQYFFDAAIAFAQHQNMRSIVLLGHGSGAYWASRYISAKHPAQVQKLRS